MWGEEQQPGTVATLMSLKKTGALLNSHLCFKADAAHLTVGPGVGLGPQSRRQERLLHKL